MDAALIPAFHDALVVAQTGSVGEAARRLHKTASAVSQQIRRIEARFGVALFEKVGRGIRPSAAGEALLGSLTRLFDEAASLEALLGEMTAARVTTLRIAASDYLGEALLLPVLRRLFAEGAPLRFEITTTNSIEAGRLAANGQVDVTMISTDRPLGRDETRLCAQRFFWIAPRAPGPRPSPSVADSAANPCCAWAPGARGAAFWTSCWGGCACARCRQSTSPACRCCCPTCGRGWASGSYPASRCAATTAATWPSRPPTSRRSTSAWPAAPR